MTILEAFQSITVFGVPAAVLLTVPLAGISSLVKRRFFGNQLPSVKNTIGFAFALIILLALSLFFAVAGAQTRSNALGNLTLISLAFASVSGSCALMSWAYSIWQGRTESKQILMLDLPIIFFAVGFHYLL